MNTSKLIQKYEKEAGLTVKETKFIFDAAVLSNDWKRRPQRYDNAHEKHQKRHLTNARKIVDGWAKFGTKEYAFDELSSSETGVLLIRRFKLWCKERAQPVGISSPENAPGDAVLANADTFDELDVDGLEPDPDWEDVDTEDEILVTSEPDRPIANEATSSHREETSVVNADVLPNNPPGATPNVAYDDEKFVEDDKKFLPRFEVEEDTLWRSLTFLQVNFRLSCFFLLIHLRTPVCDHDN